MPTSESDQSTDLTHSRRIKSAIQVIPENGKKFVPRSPSGSPDSRGSYDRERDVKKRRHDSSASDADTDEERRRRKKKKKRTHRSESSESEDERRKGRERRERRRGYNRSRNDDNDNYDRHTGRQRVYERDYDDGRRRGLEGEKARDRREKEDEREKEEDTRRTANDETKEKEPKKPPVNDILTRAGGAYIPPGRLRLMQQQIEDKNSVEYQRIAWEALKKSLNGLVNKVNVANIADIVQDMFNENVIRGRGVLCQSLMRAQVASPMFTNVYAALVAIINTKLPKIGELLLRRLILQFRRAFKRNDKTVCMNSARFIAHLVNQNVAHEILGLELLTLLLQNPTNDSVEVAIAFLKEIGQKLTEVSPRGLHAVFERLRNILHEGEIDKRVQYMVEVMFAIRKDGFKDHEPVVKDLDLVEEEDQITHLLRLDEGGQTEDGLNVFKLDPEYQINEDKYKQIKKEIIGGGSSDESSGEEDGDDDDDEDEEEEDNEEEAQKKTVDIIDNTETNLVALRRTIYLTIQSSLDYEECAHKMMRMQLKPGQEHEFCLMIIECCSQQRSYEKFFGLLAQRFSLLKKEFMEEYVKLFQEQYETIHRLDTNKLRNTAKLFAHLLYSDAIPWTVMQSIKLNEEDTTSSSRIFIKILFQELAEYMGMPKLNERLRDEVLAPFFEGLLPRDNPKNTRFAINFFTAIGLGGLTDDLREHLKNAPKMIMAQAQNVESSDSDSSSSSDSGSDDSSGDSSSESESSSGSEDERKTKKKHTERRSIKTSHSSRKSPPQENPKKKKGRRRDS